MSVHNPSFFKLIITSALGLQKLGIPNKFMKKYGEHLSEVVSLNVPSGAVWKVKLVRENDKAWFKGGWPEFVEFYSITLFYFLMFTFKGNSCFDVIIFDKSASEIEYPVDVNEYKINRKRKRQTVTESTPNCSKNVVAPEKVYGFRCDLTPDEKKKVEDYKCEHPSFVVKIKPSQVKFKCSVNIPLEFARKYLKKELGKFHIQTATGKTWSMTCASSGATHVSLTKGWRSFALDNELQVGDICVFELINSAKKMFRVGIFPAMRGKIMSSTMDPKLEAE